ncbi:amidophosphoribosyltransferase [Caldiplasma sukawensis]
MDSQHQDSEITTGLKVNESCAVIGINGTGDVFTSILTGLRSLQHRGQENSGIATFNNNRISAVKVKGLVSEGFTRFLEENEPLPGNVGIGHNRYSTQGLKDVTGAGPFLISTMIGDMAISHNGEIANYDELREMLKEKGVPFTTKTDTEVMLNLLGIEIKQSGIKNGIRNAMEKMIGSYSAILMIQERMFAIRDPNGFKPLIIGKTKDSIIVASESCALDTLDAMILRDVEPGEVVEIKKDEIISLFTMKTNNVSHCMFEYVYFARPDSIIDGIEVYRSRINMGRELAKESPVDGDIVIPVPDSGRSQAYGFSLESKIIYDEGLFKNRYSERTFIMPEFQDRHTAVKIKLNPIKSVVDGKRVILVDDSIVRGTTMKKIISLIRDAGAKEVHVRIGSPKIVAPCYFGIDMKTRKELIGAEKTEDEIARDIGADSLKYLSIEGLAKSIGMSRKELCTGCLTGEYPVKVKGERLVGQARIID